MTHPAKGCLRQAFLVTVPVLFGYLFLGLAFGILLQHAGYSFRWALFMAVVIYAGTMQYLAIPFLVQQTGLGTVALTTLLVHFRHLVYGLSFLDRFRTFGWRKIYMIFALTDETYALMCASKVPEGVSEERFLFWIALLDQLYWIIGCVAGASIGSVLPINAAGIDFAMTALFIVIAVEQWRTAQSHLPAAIGAGAAVVSLIIFGGGHMILPAVLLMIACLMLLRRRLEPVIAVQREVEP